MIGKPGLQVAHCVQHVAVGEIERNDNSVELVSREVCQRRR